MTHKELLQFGAKTFNFHPDEPFTSVEQILETARKNFSNGAYECGAALLAERLARYCDEHNEK